MGGKVVKNAAGFDLPKFFVGSLGRFGVLAETTFKVFPRPACALTLRLAADKLEAAALILNEAASSRFEFDALDLAPGEPGVLVRIAGPEPSLSALTPQILARWPGEVLPDEVAESLWNSLREFRWSGPDRPLVKVSLSPNAVVPLGHAIKSLNEAEWHLSAGGNVAFVSLATDSHVALLDEHLRRLGLAGLVLRGSSAPGLWLGARSRPAITAAVKQALDPANRFPSLDD
jgi:glycolate oxidase FAD binding subunit